MRLATLPLLLLAVAGLSSAVRGLEITTRDGETYENCEIMRVEADSLVISHAVGIARIPYEKLPNALQDRYFDPFKVAAHRRKILEEAERAAAAKAAREQKERELPARKAKEYQRLRAEQTTKEAPALASPTPLKDSSDPLAGPLVIVFLAAILFGLPAVVNG